MRWGVLGSGERAFILGSTLYRDLDTRRLRELAGRGLNWIELGEAALRAGLGAAVAQAVAETDIGADVPAPVAGALNAALHRNTALNMALLGSLTQALSVLSSAGVEAVPIKGTGLLLCEPALLPIRTAVDIDLMVRRRDLAAAFASLVGSGWRPLESPLTVSLGGQALEARQVHPEVQHGVPLADAQGSVIELHVALPAAQGQPRDVDQEFFSRCVVRRWRQGEIRCPSPDDALAIACEHVLAHHRDDPIHLPKLMIDLQALESLGASSATARSRLGADSAKFVDQAAAILEEVRRGSARPGWLGDGRVERLLSPAWVGVAELQSKVRRMAEGPRRIMKALRADGIRYVFPSRAYMEVRYGIRPGSATVFAYYLWRPIGRAIRWVARAGGR